MPAKQLQLLQGEPNSDVIIDLPVESLLFDSQNPRLARHPDEDTQQELIKTLWSEMAVDEVAFSIAENGFFRSEPLFVIIQNPNEIDVKKKKYIVIEGNRRLAAVRLLRDQKLREKIKADDLPEITDDRRNSLAKLPAIIYKDREQLWTSIGFRHINGIKPWDSFSKAKYIAEVHEKYKIPLDEIAQKIGDRHSTVKRLYRGYKVLEQAEGSGVFDKEDSQRNKFYFSHLYTAADQKEFQEFLGIKPENLKGNPVPKAKMKELDELMTYLYGKKSEEKKPLIESQNPDLNLLREVISKPEALSALRNGYPLKDAHNVALGDSRRFRDAVTKVKVELQNAKAAVVPGYSGEEDLFRSVQEIIRVVNSLKEDMNNIRLEKGK